MKNLFALIYILIFSMFITSCEDYLEPEVITELSVEQATTEYNYSKSRVASIYSDIPSGFTRINGAMLASASDESEHTQENSSVHHFNRGSWNEFQNPDNLWGHLYRGIRKVNQFLVTSDNINLDIYKFNPDQQDVYNAYIDEINRWKHEVRFLRAYFYFELVKRYGGVPLITTVATPDDNFDTVERNTLEECINFIVNECDATAAVLPARYDNTETGRVTKIAALALKSRVLLYSASELYNNPSWASGYAKEKLISVNKDRQTLWENAAEAAKNVIDVAEANGYSLSSNYSDIFGPGGYQNSEVIFCKREGGSNYFERTNISVGFDFGQSGTTPTQNLVDAYEMSNGKPITDPESGYDPNNPYENRDPRLALTIVTNNSNFKGRRMEMWNGGQDGPPIVNSTKTGYYLKKYVNENLNLITGQTSAHNWIIFRLTEFYMNYAEALNECDPGNPDIKTYIDMVRQRNGINMPPLPPALSQSQMRERIINERQVEFAFEEHRIWDVRRWMEATSVFSSPIKGMKISKNSEDNFIYNIVNVESRNFLPKMYLYPIPQNEMNIAKGIVQNPLW